MNLSGWSFRADLAGDPKAGTPARLTVDLHQPADTDERAVLEYVIETWAELAKVGGWGGDQVAPGAGKADFAGPSIAAAGASRLSWDFKQLAVDPRAVLGLLNAVDFALRSKVRAVWVQCSGSDPQGMTFERDTLPPPWPRLGFAIDDDRTSSSVEVHVTFVDEQSDLERAVASLQLWLDAGATCAFRDPDAKPEHGFLLPVEHEGWVVEGDVALVYLEDSGVVEGAYDALLNVAQAIHDAFAPIRSVEVY